MRIIIIFTLSFLLLSSSINAEEKNEAITESVKNSEIKVLEKQINIQIKALKDELALRPKPMEKWYLLSAVLLGAVLGFFGTEISARRRRKEEQIEKRKTLTDDIVGDSLKFIYKTGDIINNIIAKKKYYLALIKANPSAASDETESLIFKNYTKEMDEGFFTELIFYSYQLKRLNNQEIYDEFETVHNAYEALFEILFKDNTLDNVKDAKDKCMTLVKEFTTKCIEISKV